MIYGNYTATIKLQKHLKYQRSLHVHFILQEADVYFVHQMLIAAGHQLFERIARGQAGPDEIAALKAVQQTFPGALAIATSSIVRDGGKLNRALLEFVLLPFEDNIPEVASSEQIASFQKVLGLLKEEDKNWLKIS